MRLINKINVHLSITVPYAIIVTVNVMMVYFVIKAKTRVAQVADSLSKQKKFAISMFVALMIYIIFTVPAPVMRGYYFAYAQTLDGRVLINFFIIFRFTYQSSNLLVFYIVNSKFRSEVNNIKKAILIRAYL